MITSYLRRVYQIESTPPSLIKFKYQDKIQESKIIFYQNNDNLMLLLPFRFCHFIAIFLKSSKNKKV